MTKWLMAVALTAAGITAGAQAQTPECQNCQANPAPAPAYAGPSYGGGGGHFNHPTAAHPWTAHPTFGSKHFNRSGNLSRQPTLPVYMAAPWYLYWPYDGHFQTVAPMAAGAQWMPPPQSAFGANPTLPTFPGFVPFTPNQTFPNFGAPAVQPNVMPPNFNPAPPVQPSVIPINPAPVVPPAKVVPAPPAKLLPGGELPKVIPN